MRKTTFVGISLFLLTVACKEKKPPMTTFSDVVEVSCFCMTRSNLNGNAKGLRACLDSVAMSGRDILLKHCFSNVIGPDGMALHAAKQVLLDSLSADCELFAENGQKIPVLPGYWLSGKTLDVSLGTKLDSVTVNVSNNMGESFRFQSDKHGNYKLLLPLRHAVTLTYSKPGYVSKKILLHFDTMPDGYQNVLFESVVDMRLFQLVEGFDTSVADEPIGIMYFNEEQATFAYDFAHTERMQAAIAAEFERLGLPLYKPSNGVRPEDH